MKGRAIEYNKKELAWIKRNCKWPTKKAWRKFCKFFDRDDVSLTHYNSLRKRKGWLTGRTGCYEKGCTPENKGKKMPYNANTAKTQFKKGNKPHTAKYLGHERICSKDGYVYLNIGETNPHTGAVSRYVLKHKYLWEKKNGKLPKGHCLKCLDGNRQNTTPSNWEAVSRGILPFLVKGGKSKNNYDYDEMPDEIKPSVLALAKVKYAKSKLKKEIK